MTTRRLTSALPVLLAVALSSAPGPALAGPVEEVTAAETAFAKAFADRDAERFFAFLLDDATFLSANGTLSGKGAVRERWSRYFVPKTAPFRWAPDRVVASADGQVALSTGPVTDAAGTVIGHFASVWRRLPSGEWKVQFDGPGGEVCPPAPAAAAPAATAATAATP